MKIFAVIMSILIVLYLIGNITFKIMFDPKSRRPDINKMGRKEGADMQGGFPSVWLEGNENVKDAYIESVDEIKLHAVYTKKDERHDWAIILHGYTSEGARYAAYAEHYFEKGYNFLLPDARAHGKSQGQFIGMGWPDRLDLIEWCKFIIDTDPKAEIIIHGMSMGAATALHACGEKLPQQVKLIISDSAFPSTGKVMRHQIKHTMHLPEFPLLDLADLVCRMKCGYSFLHDGNTAEAVAKASVPVFFIHGRKDNFVPIAMHEEIYAACNSPKDRLIIDEGHVMGRFKQEELYWQNIDAFIAKHRQGV